MDEQVGLVNQGVSKVNYGYTLDRSVNCIEDTSKLLASEYIAEAKNFKPSITDQNLDSIVANNPEVLLVIALEKANRKSNTIINLIFGGLASLVFLGLLNFISDSDKEAPKIVLGILFLFFVGSTICWVSVFCKNNIRLIMGIIGSTLSVLALGIFLYLVGVFDLLYKYSVRERSAGIMIPLVALSILSFYFCLGNNLKRKGLAVEVKRKTIRSILVAILPSIALLVFSSFIQNTSNLIRLESNSDWVLLWSFSMIILLILVLACCVLTIVSFSMKLKNISRQFSSISAIVFMGALLIPLLLSFATYAVLARCFSFEEFMKILSSYGLFLFPFVQLVNALAFYSTTRQNQKYLCWLRNKLSKKTNQGVGSIQNI